MAEGQKTGGRAKGTPNKATREIKELCRSYGPEMVEGLVGLARGAESETARAAAMKEVLDRGYGKATQMLGSDKDNPIRAKIEVEFVKAGMKVVNG